LSAKVERSRSPLRSRYRWIFITFSSRQKGATWNGAINIFFVQKDGAGKVLNITEEAFDLRLKKTDYETYLRTGMALNKSIALKLGAKTLRILTVDRSNGVIGSLIIPLSQVK